MTRLEFAVRPVQPADTASVAEHFLSVADEPLFVLTTAFPRTLEQTTQFLELVRATAHVNLLIATEGSKTIGHCLVRSTDHPALRHVAKISMAVSTDFRRSGVGKKLLEEAEEWARRHKIHKITLDVLANNRPALRLYEKLRYREEGARKDQVIIDGQFHDELMLAKFLEH
jgi:ribosomal protein S18 acetylase RimI-like enzyme